MDSRLKIFYRNGDIREERVSNGSIELNKFGEIECHRKVNLKKIYIGIPR
ncbi:MAG: hypothetical protein N3B13_00155 [Deltaproteobacteria bacterium]|nr:hypothetical protein [Deltaproteobacteria bacterium]